MPSKNKARGSRLEYSVVRKAVEAGVEAERCWGSDGRSMGLTKNADVVVGGLPFQCKKRKVVASYVQPEKDVAGQIIQQDYGPILVVLRLEDYLDLVKE